MASQISNLQPLEQNSLLSTRSFNELEAFVATKGLKIHNLKTAHDHAQSKFKLNAIQLPNVCISYIRYGVPVAMFAENGYPDYCLSILCDGSFSLNFLDEQINATTKVATLSSPSHELNNTLGADSSRFCVALKQSSVVMLLESMLDKPISTPLLFKPGVQLDSQGGQSLVSLLNLILHDANQGIESLQDPLVSHHYEQLLMSIFLSQLRHNFSDSLLSDHPSPAPQDIKRVCDYIHEHLHEAISIADLVSISGVSGRSLFLHFKKFTGCTPHAYIIEQRLAMARKDLIDNKPGDTVTQIAMRWGFTQLGRFSGLYKSIYGELPRDTLQRSPKQFYIN